MSKQIHQLLAVFDEADAQGSMALFLQDIFKRWGWNSNIYAGNTAPGQKSKVLPAGALPFPGDPSEILIFHYSIDSPAGEIFRKSSRSRILIYHNITPADFFRGYDDLTYLECRKGRAELKKFIPACDLALADSDFNASELTGIGFPRVKVLPFPLDKRRLEGPSQGRVRRNFGKGDRTNLLFVGRLAPNKKQEDILRVFYYYQKYFNPASRLFLIGAPHIRSYDRALHRLKDSLGLNEAYFTGKISWDELRAYYRIADLFLCLSEHEGFCVPLLESLYFNIPIIAYRAAAIPEILGGRGILLEKKEPLKIACLIDRILSDKKLKNEILDGQKQRLAQLQQFPFEEKLKGYLQTFLNILG